MTDDLVKRLQDYLDCRPWAAGRTFDPTHPECLIAQAKDRIEQLEREKASWKGAYDGAVIAMTDRIEALKAALRKLDDMIYELDAGDLDLYEVGDFIDAALGEKKDG